MRCSTARCERWSDRGAQRLLLHVGSSDRRALVTRIRPDNELGERLERFWRPEARSGERCHRRRLAGLAQFDGTVNWEPPAFSRKPAFYMWRSTIRFRSSTDGCGSARLHGPGRQGRSGSWIGGSYLTAIDYKTGKAAWRHRYYSGGGGGGGLLATAGGLVFAGDGAGSLVAHDAATEKPYGTRGSGRYQSAADLHAGWPPVCDRRDRRQGLVVHALLTRSLPFIC